MIAYSKSASFGPSLVPQTNATTFWDIRQTDIFFAKNTIIYTFYYAPKYARIYKLLYTLVYFTELFILVSAT